MPSEAPRGSGGYFVVSVRDVPTSRHLDRLLSQNWRLVAVTPSDEPHKLLTLVYQRSLDTGERHLVETRDELPDESHLAERSANGWLPVDVASYMARTQRGFVAVYRRSREDGQLADSSTIPPFEPWVFVESVPHEARQKQQCFSVRTSSSIPEAQAFDLMLRQGWHLVTAAAADEETLAVVYTRGAEAYDRHRVEELRRVPGRELLEARLGESWKLITLTLHSGRVLGVFRRCG